MAALRSFARVLARLHRSGQGTATVELATVFLPLMILTFSAFDSAMLMFTDALVTSAVHDAAREIRTGQLRNASDYATFRQKVCDRTLHFLDCSKLAIDVRSFASWPSVSWPAPQIAEDGSVSNFDFQLGGARAITVVRAVYLYRVLTPGLSFAVDHLNRMATSVLVTEPFQ
jgi:Flp pilus assembly protein TadG